MIKVLIVDDSATSRRALSQMLGEVGEGTLRSAHELMQVARQMRQKVTSR